MRDRLNVDRLQTLAVELRREEAGGAGLWVGQGVRGHDAFGCRHSTVGQDGKAGRSNGGRVLPPKLTLIAIRRGPFVAGHGAKCRGFKIPRP